MPKNIRAEEGAEDVETTSFNLLVFQVRELNPKKEVIPSRRESWEDPQDSQCQDKIFSTLPQHTGSSSGLLVPPI